MASSSGGCFSLGCPTGGGPCALCFSLWGNQDVVQALEQEYRESGYEGALLAAANRLADRSRKTRVRRGLVAVLYLRAGERDLALEWLERASQGPNMEILMLKSGRLWDPIRSDPRFQDILRRMNFPE